MTTELDLTGEQDPTERMAVLQERSVPSIPSDSPGRFAGSETTEPFELEDALSNL